MTRRPVNRRRQYDPAAPLVRALLADAAATGALAEATCVDSRGWSSATFAGARHRVVMTGSALAPWAGRLTGDRLRLPRQWLGELTVDAADPARIVISALVIDDGDERSGGGPPPMR